MVEERVGHSGQSGSIVCMSRESAEMDNKGMAISGMHRGSFMYGVGDQGVLGRLQLHA